MVIRYEFLQPGSASVRDAKSGSKESGFMTSRSTSPHSTPRYLTRMPENPEKPAAAAKALVRRRQSNFAREVLVRPIFDLIAGSTFGKADRRAG